MSIILKTLISDIGVEAKIIEITTEEDFVALKHSLAKSPYAESSPAVIGLLRAMQNVRIRTTTEPAETPIVETPLQGELL